MSKLINPGLGELADRASILQLKILHGDPDKTAHFADEQAQVQMHLERHTAGLGAATPAVEKLLRALAEVNTDLWQKEDQMAEYAQHAHKYNFQGRAPAIAKLGMEIWTANRERGRIIGEINVLAGTDTGPEKL